MMFWEFWEFQQLEIYFPRCLGFSRVFNRSWATVFVPQIGNRSSACWLAQFMCETCAQATGEIGRLSRCRPRKLRCDGQRNLSCHSTRLVTLHVFLVRPDIKTLSANTSPLALTDETPQHLPQTCSDSTALTTPRHSHNNTLHKHVQTPRHTKY